MSAVEKKYDLGKIRIRSNQSLLDGLVGTANLATADQLIELTLSEEAPQADLETGDHILVPLPSITFMHKIG